MHQASTRQLVPFFAIATMVCVLSGAGEARAQIPGDPVNMVSGRGWPGGDPFLQRQNEPSIAVSTANPEHLLAGANDYRSVDLALSVDGETGDAWLGVFKSFDGGQTWKSYLMPGYPHDPTSTSSTLGDCTPPGATTPVPCTSAADPVVRAGPDGMFYFSGITFVRGQNYGRVFVSRWLDRNSKENGDPIQGSDTVQFLDAQIIDMGTATAFADKPWIAVDVPRAGAQICPETGKPTGNVYIAWARVYPTTPETGDIFFSQSADCGHHWTAPLQLNKNSSRVSQGAVIAIDPPTGDIYVAWRRFAYAPNKQTDGIVVVRSFHFGRKFTPEKTIAPIYPFDQDPSTTVFRSEALPTIAISVAPPPNQTKSWVHVAWAARATPTGDGKIWMSTAPVKPPPADDDESDDDVGNWTTPTPIDGGALTDAQGTTYARGHQLMPQLTFSQGRLMAVYYDSRMDHTRKYYRPRVPFRPDAGGSFYDVLVGPMGELVSNPALVWDVDLDEKALIDAYAADTDPYRDTSGKHRRHTVEVRVARALPGPTPAFTTVQVSNMPFGEPADLAAGQSADVYGPNGVLGTLPLTGSPDPTRPDYVTVLALPQLGFNPPNLPLFRTGTTPFMGDYIDIQGPAFVNKGGTWSFNTDYAPSPVFHAIWTTNQDVRPPLDGNWANYTPIRLPGQSTSKLTGDPLPNLDPATCTSGIVVNGCCVGQEGMRDQNIYTSRITEGLLVSSPQNAKPLTYDPATGGTLRAFVILAQNTTGVRKPVKFSVTPPAGVSASFQKDGTLQSFDVWVPPYSHVYRALFVRALSAIDPGTSVTVNVREVDPNSPANCIDAIPAVPCAVLANGASGAVILNPPGQTPVLVPPDGAPGDVNKLEIYAANIGNANIGNANIGNANIGNFSLTTANIGNANIGNANIGNSGISAAHIANYSVANIGNANIGNANIGNANIGNANIGNANIGSANIGNANIGNANIGNASISDANYSVTNTGNTTMSYRVVLVGSTTGAPLQLILSKPYATPVGAYCTLAERPANRVVLSIDDPYVVTDPTQVPDPNVPDPSTRNATFAIAPGETAQITIRGPLDVLAMTQLASQLTPVVVPHSGGSPSLIIDPRGALPAPNVGQPYTGSVPALGGTGPYTWIVGGSLPAGLTSAPSADTGSLVISGVPTAAAGTVSTFTVTVTDAAQSPATASKTFTLQVVQGTPVVTVATDVASPVFGQPVQLTATVAPQGAGGPVPTGSVQFLDGMAVVGSAILDGTGTGRATVTGLSVGTHSFGASYGGDANYRTATSAAATATVSKAASTVLLTSLTGTSVYGQPVTLQASVAAAPPGAGTPTGFVVFTSQGLALPAGTVPLTGGSATYTVAGPLPTGTATFAATYGGDASFTGTTSATLSQTVQAAATTTAIVTAPNASTYGQDVAITATVSVVSPGSGTPTGYVTYSDGGKSLGTAPLGTPFYAKALAGGSHTLTGTYGGDSSFATSTSAGYTQTVLTVLPTLSVQQAGPASFGQLVGLLATVGPTPPGAAAPGGTVSFTEGGVLLGSATITAGTGGASVALKGGTHSIAATYSGDTNYSPAQLAVPATVYVAPAADGAAMTSSLNASTYGQSVTFTMFVLNAANAPVPEGSVNFYDGTLLLNAAPVALDPTTGSATFTIATLGAGTHAISATYLGTANYQSVSASLPGFTTGSTGQQVNPVPTQATLATSASTVPYGTSVTFTCTVTSATAVPTGPVQFAVNGATAFTVALDGTGTARWTTSALPAGSSVVTCVYPSTSSPNFLASGSNPVSEVVNNVSTTTTLTSSPNPPMDDKSFTLTATVKAVNGGAPTGTVTFKDGTTKVLGTVTLTAAMAGKASLTVASTSEGSHTFSATYGGDATYAASTGTLTVKVLEDYSCDAYDSPLVRSGSVSSPSYSGSKTYGTTVAVRFRFKKPTGVYVSRTSSIQELKAVQDPYCNGKPPAGAATRTLYTAAGGLAGGNTLTWESSTGYFNLGWATSSASKGCWLVVLTPDNGVPPVATYLKLQCPRRGPGQGRGPDPSGGEGLEAARGA